MLNYPRVLVIAMGRINAADQNNNGLLLRRLFEGWPRESLAQIFSSNDNGDPGYFGRYYRLGPSDRRFGGLFYRLKRESVGERESRSAGTSRRGWYRLRAAANSFISRFLVDTGLYELAFRPRISREMCAWVEDFRPDFIFAQGYSLSFAWLPVQLKRRLGCRLAFLTTDDWPGYLYSGNLGEPTLFRPLMRFSVQAAARNLIACADLPFAFGPPMAEEYAARYRKEFLVLSHVDDPVRFAEAKPQRCHPDGIFTILTTGHFNRFRWPCLLDLNECCRILERKGMRVRVAVLAAGIDPQAKEKLQQAEYIDIYSDPGDALLPSYLLGSDVLTIIEGFDQGWISSIGLSVSTKSHLFMMAGKPILVYSDRASGVARYAEAHGWAFTVTKRDVDALADLLFSICQRGDEAVQLHIRNSAAAVNRFHLASDRKDSFLAAFQKMSCER